MSDTIRLSLIQLHELIKSTLLAAGVDPDNARSVTEALASAEIDGKKGHALSRVPTYCLQVRSGKVDGRVRPSSKVTKPGVVVVDAKNGFAFPALDLARAELRPLVKTNGIAMAAISRSHHCGVAGWHVEQLAHQGLVALMFCNTPKAIAPWGGNKALFGTNPIAFAAPRKDAPPLIIDLATSQIARGLILKASQSGQTIPEGWAFDNDGNPTTDAAAALEGTMAPLGGVKGASLALMVELLAVALTGAHFGYEASSFFTDEGGAPGVGQLLIALDPDAGIGNSLFLERVEDLVAEIEKQAHTRIPGGNLERLRKSAESEGIEVSRPLYEEVLALGSAE